MLKHFMDIVFEPVFCQPPSGGCVLKQIFEYNVNFLNKPAAFGRLCVETFNVDAGYSAGFPAAFGRLCVETIQFIPSIVMPTQPPSGGCVLKQCFPLLSCCYQTSRLRAAVC